MRNTERVWGNQSQLINSLFLPLSTRSVISHAGIAINTNELPIHLQWQLTFISPCSDFESTRLLIFSFFLFPSFFLLRLKVASFIYPSDSIVAKKKRRCDYYSWVVSLFFAFPVISNRLIPFVCTNWKKKKKIEKVESIRLFHRIVIIISKILTSTLFLHHFPFMRSEIKILEEDLDRRIRLKSDRLVFLSSSTGWLATIFQRVSSASCGQRNETKRGANNWGHVII